MELLPPGKLPAALLARLLARYVPRDPRVVLGPGIGEDAAVIDMGDRYLVAKTDPITFAAAEIGWYAVHVNANDVACCGAAPKWFLATVLLPERGTSEALAESIFAQIAAACGPLGVTLCGGHTEITVGLDRPIVVGQMLGEVAPDAFLATSNAAAGDVLLLTKGIAIEGTAIIAHEKRGEVRALLSEEEIEHCAGLLHEPGISVVRDAEVAIAAGGVHALHDPTEGGVATGLRELAEAAGVGIIVEQASLPVLPECARLCAHFGLDPLGLIASGALLIAAEERCAPEIIDRLEEASIAVARIGRCVAPEEGCRIRAPDGAVRPLPAFARDEIARMFEG